MPEYGTKHERLMIDIPRWDEFQHYKSRQPIWIKNYPRLLDSDAYLELTMHQRGVLHGLWMLYAKSGREIPHNTARLTRQLGHRVTRATLESLRDAGFIEILASNVLAQRREEKSRKTLASREPVDNSTAPLALALVTDLEKAQRRGA